jgi:hypothetical protein
MNETKPKTSTDDFDISMHLLKILFTLMNLPLVNIFNLCLCQGIFPKNLYIANVVSIFKKGDHTNVNNYRTISILPHISKL